MEDQFKIAKLLDGFVGYVRDKQGLWFERAKLLKVLKWENIPNLSNDEWFIYTTNLAPNFTEVISLRGIKRVVDRLEPSSEKLALQQFIVETNFDSLKVLTLGRL